MLYIVLILVIVAFGLLITALATAETVFAWLSVLVSVAAAALLVLDWINSRRRITAASAARSPQGDGPGRAGTSADPGATDVFARVVDDDDDFPTEISLGTPNGSGNVAVPSNEEPPEEPTDAADVLVVAGLDVEVVVVDERPRYHLATCSWLSGRPTIPIPVGEARQLGFTPCALCGPDRVLVSRHRASSGGGR